MEEPWTMEDKTVIITGSNSGIGKETARELARRGARIIMACRNLETAEVAKADIIDTTKNTKVIIKKLDLSSFASIREFAEDINSTEAKLNILIHNAGFAEFHKKSQSIDGIEMTMATNHYGPFLLTHLLIDLVKRSTPSRIVVVTSYYYWVSRVDLEHPNPITKFPGRNYFQSKFANIYFTKELARRLAGSGVTANVVHPGLVDTPIWKNIPAPLSWFLTIINKCFFITPQEGAKATVLCAMDEKFNDVTGRYFSRNGEQVLTAEANDMVKAKNFWEISESIVRLSNSDPRI